MRVSRGNQVSAGVVQVNINNNWGSICDNEWSDTNTREFTCVVHLLYSLYPFPPSSKCVCVCVLEREREREREKERLTWTIKVCNDQCWACWVIVRHGKNFTVTVFLDTLKAINVKFCLMVLVIELYLFIPLSVTLTIFQGHRSVKQF